MAKWFYTDREAEQQGPVDDQTLLGLNREGAIDARSLVWRDGMADWEPFREVAGTLFGETEEGTPVQVGVCAHSSQIYPLSEMIPYGEALVGKEHKEAFVQRLMETGRTGIEDATEKKFEYVGFWWRCLSSFIDYLVKMVPTWLCAVPQYIVMGTMGAVPGETDSAGFPIALAIAQGIGALGMLAVSIWYETWMVGKYEATLGKMVIGAKVVNPDGSRLGYKRAFFRWMAKKPLNYIVMILPSAIVMGIVIAAIGGTAGESEGSATFVMGTFAGIFAAFFVGLLAAGVYWMAAFDPEKRALHDRVASTRVIRK